MDRRLLTGILLGVLLGVVLGVEVINLADERVCPQPACVGRASVIPLSDRGYFEAAHKLFSGASESIYIAAFEVKYYENFPESSVNVLVEDLISARKRGVDVRVIVDEYSKENNAFEKLRNAGVPIKYDSADVTTHAKLIIVDGEVVLIGSTNLSYFGLENNNEVDVIIRDGKTAEYFERYFEDLWAG